MLKHPSRQGFTPFMEEFIEYLLKRPVKQTVAINYVKDPNHKLNLCADGIGQLWLHFRMTNPTCLAKYPKISHLEISDPEVITKLSNLYENVLLPLFLSFISLENAELRFIANEVPSPSFIVVKQKDIFMIGDGIVQNSTSGQALMKYALSRGQQTGYTGRSVILGLAEC